MKAEKKAPGVLQYSVCSDDSCHSIAQKFNQNSLASQCSAGTLLASLKAGEVTWQSRTFAFSKVVFGRNNEQVRSRNKLLGDIELSS